MATLGIDLGGTKIALGVLEGEELVYEARVPTPREGPEAVMQTAIAAAREAIAEAPVGVEAIGVGSLGRIDYETGSIALAANITGFKGIPVAEWLREALGKPVYVENDANAAALAEHHLGAARGARSSFFVTISTGIGSGLVVDDRVLRGAFGQAGELGHVVVLPGGPVCGCGNRGCLEAVASGRAMARDAGYAYARPVDTPEVFALWREGDAKAAVLVESSAGYVGQALADVQKLFDPEVIVIGGGVGIGGGDEYMDLVREAYARHLRVWRRAEIRPARLLERAGVIGAALVARFAN